MKKRYLILIAIIIVGGLSFTVATLRSKNKFSNIRPEVKRAIDNNIEAFADSDMLKGAWADNVTFFTLNDLGLSSINELSNDEREYLDKVIYEK